VVGALSALGAQPIETLAVERARTQPTPADAVRRVLGERDRSTAPRPVAQVTSSSRPLPAPSRQASTGRRRAALARRLREAGVPVERRVYEGVTHEFFGMAPAVADAGAAQDFVGDRLRAALGGRSRVAAPR
jgi:acetyl esterase/lipase